MKIKILIIIVLIATILVSCNKTETIKIGVTGTMSGSQSDLSVSGRRGIKLAVNEINKSGGLLGKQIELVVKDDMYSAKRAEEIVREFVNEGIEIVIGPYTSGMMLAAYDEVISNEILYLGPTISTDSLNRIDDNFIRFIASTKIQAEMISNHAVKSDLENFIIVYDNENIGFNVGFINNFIDFYGLSGGNVISEIGFSEVDNILIEKIIDNINEVDSILIIAGASDLAMISQNLKKANILVPLYGPLWAHTNDLLRIGGSNVDNVYVVSGININDNNDDFLNLKLLYEETYGDSLTFSTIFSYDAMYALKTVIENENTIEWQNVKKGFLNQTFSGAQANFLIDKYGDTTRLYSIDVIRNGEFVSAYEK